jgi:hypothetical protein
MTIPSLPTTVGGITFRSRLEARWSMVFTGLGVPWEYEPDDGKYQLPSGMYWPDFRLFGGTEIEFWVEIKGPMPDSREFHVASELNLYVAPCTIFCGDLPRRTNGGTAWVFEPEGRRWIMRDPEQALIQLMGIGDQVTSLEWEPVISQARTARWDKATGKQLEST